jgi:predicted dehydrogenase
VLRSLIVGFGNSGRGLHLRSLLRARRLCKGEPVFANSEIVAVDPRLYAKPRAREDRTVLLTRSLDRVDGIDPAATVAHVCTPPVARAETLRRLADRGYSKIICEKPVAGSLHDLRDVLDVVTGSGMDTAVVSPWLSSGLTLALGDLVRSGALGALQSIAIVQRKPRFTRTRDAVDHPSAYEIEIPHSVGVALHLAGAEASVAEAECADLTLEGVTYEHLGGAYMELRHEGGVATTIECDLTAPVRERSIELRFEHGTALGHYPIGDDTYAQLRVSSEPERRILRDDQLTAMMIAWYSHFAGLAPRPVSDLRFNLKVMDVIADAKRIAGIADAERIIEASPAAEAVA